MRIATLGPAATEIVFALGLGDSLVGVSADCDFPPEARDRPVVATGDIPDETALLLARPDLVIVPGPATHSGANPRTRSHRGGLDELIAHLPGEVEVLLLAPLTIEGILNSIQAVGAMTAAEDAAVSVVEGLRERLTAVEEIVVGRRDGGRAAPRVAVLETLEPSVASAAWIGEQVRLAGAWEVLGAGRERVDAAWDEIRELDPDIIVLAPMVVDLAAAIDALAREPRPPAWAALRAAREGHAYVIDGRGLVARPGPRVVDGIEALAELIDPPAFDGMAPIDSWARIA